VRGLLAGASACTACIAGTYSGSTGAGCAALGRGGRRSAEAVVIAWALERSAQLNSVCEFAHVGIEVFVCSAATVAC
jgi:hypothetical protein